MNSWRRKRSLPKQLRRAATTGGDEVNWTSSDENVAKLSATNGEIVNVAAINESTATITCTLLCGQSGRDPWKRNLNHESETREGERPHRMVSCA